MNQIHVINTKSHRKNHMFIYSPAAAAAQSFEKLADSLYPLKKSQGMLLSYFTFCVSDDINYKFNDN